MTAERDITNDCVAIAFYGVTADPTSLASFYSHLIEWFDSVECPPDRIAVEGVGFSGNPVGFARTHSRLSKGDFSQVKAIETYSMLQNGRKPLVDWWATASISFDYKPAFVLEARSSVTTLEDDRLMRLIDNCVSILNPVYGIGYHRDHDKGPGFYAIGLNYVTMDNLTGDDPKEVEAVSKWGYVGMTNEVYREGLLRDVYPYNYLTKPHLEKSVGKQSLQQWIDADESRGSLSKIGEHMTLWRIASAQIEAVRGELSQYGVIFDWNTYDGQ